MAAAEHTGWDVVVLGGGPAGSTTARLLAAQGFRVLILERYPDPGRKACGGGLTTKTAQLLDFPLEEVIGGSFRQLIVSTGGGCENSYDYGRPMVYTATRRDFDGLLLRQAEQAGAQVQTGITVRAVDHDTYGVTVTAQSGQAYRARVAVGADGAHSLIARTCHLGLEQRDFCLAVAQELRATPEIAAAFADSTFMDFGLAHGGYAWVFPRGEYLNCGIGVPRPREKRLAAMYRDFVTRRGLGHLPPATPLRGAFIPRGTPLLAYHSGPCVVVGDAAGLADALSGEGIYHALRSGGLAAEVITAYLAGQTPDLSTYTQRVQAEMLPELKAARRLANLFFGPTHFFWLRVLRSERALRALGDAVTGRRSYPELWRAVKRRFSYGLLR